MPNLFMHSLQFRNKLTDFLVHRGTLNREGLPVAIHDPTTPSPFTSVVVLRKGGVVEGLQDVSVVPAV